MNVNSLLTTDYENKSNWTLGENKPNSNPIAERAKLMHSLYLQRIMKKNAAKGYEKTKPIQTQFFQRVKLMQSLYLQRIMKINADMGSEKTNPNKPNFPPILKISVLNFVKLYKILTTYEISF